MPCRLAHNAVFVAYGVKTEYLEQRGIYFAVRAKNALIRAYANYLPDDLSVLVELDQSALQRKRQGMTLRTEQN